jgi:hypothetical protein
MSDETTFYEKRELLRREVQTGPPVTRNYHIRVYVVVEAESLEKAETCVGDGLRFAGADINNMELIEVE